MSAFDPKADMGRPPRMNWTLTSHAAHAYASSARLPSPFAHYRAIELRQPAIFIVIG